VNVGDTVTYIVTANNRGPNAATNIIISDLIPASLANVVVTPSVGTYDSNTGLWIIPTLNNGASATLTITGKATVAMAGLNTTNNATRIAQDQYNQESNTTSAKVYTKKADVSLTQTVNGASTGIVIVNVGNSVTYLITATNNGPDNATLINIRDYVPVGLTGVTITPGLGTTYNSVTGLWNISNLANGTSVTLNITGQAGPSMAGHNTTNMANVISQTEYGPTIPSSTSIPVYTKKANVVLSETVNSPVNVGDLVKYVLTALNNGPDTATNILIQDFIPALAGVVVSTSVGDYNSTTGIWTIPILANGTIATLNITGTATAAMAGNNTTNTATQMGQTEYSDLFTSASANVYTKLATVSVTNIASNGSLNVGDNGYFTVTVTNNGPDTVTNINITDRINGWIPDHATVSTGTYNPVTGVWNIPSLAPGANATWTFSAIVPSYVAGTNVTNHVTESQTESPFTVSVPDATIYVKKANVVLSQTVNSPVNVGGLVTYIVTALNNGPDNATNIVISDVLPAVLAGFTVTPSVGTYNSGVWTIPSLANGTSATLSIVGNATAAMAGFNTTNTATQTGQTEFFDLYTSANATVYTKLADTKLSQTVTTPVNVGGIVTYVVTITNTGPDTATNFIIQDNIPAGLANYTVTPSTGTYINGNWTIFSLANGESATLTITGKATAAMAGKNTTNTATKITETEYDPTTIGESTEADAYTKEANVVLTQTGSYNKNNVTFIVTARNNGPDNATEVNIKDLIPAGLSGVIVTPSVGTYDVGTGIWYIPVLANGNSATLNITGTCVVQTNIINTANKTIQTEFDPSADFTVTNVYVPKVSMYIRASMANSMYSDWDYNNCPVWVADVQNNGPDDAHDVQTQFVLDKGMQFIAFDTRGYGTASYNETTNTITWNIGFMPNGGRAHMDIFFKIRGLGTLTAVHNLTYVKEFNSDLTHYQRVRSIDVNVTQYYADIAVDQVVSNYSPVKGDVITINVTVKNNGPGVAPGIVIKDLLPSKLVLLSNDTHGVGSYNSTTGVWDVGTLNSNTNATLTLTVLVNGTGTIINNAAKTAPDINLVQDPNLNNNSKEIFLNVVERIQ
jgi:uncharacterized repeat protein (TIGR01451 family)